MARQLASLRQDVGYRNRKYTSTAQNQCQQHASERIGRLLGNRLSYGMFLAFRQNAAWRSALYMTGSVRRRSSIAK